MRMRMSAGAFALVVVADWKGRKERDRFGSRSSETSSTEVNFCNASLARVFTKKSEQQIQRKFALTVNAIPANEKALILCSYFITNSLRIDVFRNVKQIRLHNFRVLHVTVCLLVSSARARSDRCLSYRMSKAQKPRDDAKKPTMSNRALFGNTL